MRPDDDTLIEDFGFDPDDLELDPDNDWGPEKVMQVLTDPASMYRLGISRELFISTAERLVEEVGLVAYLNMLIDNIEPPRAAHEDYPGALLCLLLPGDLFTGLLAFEEEMGAQGARADRDDQLIYVVPGHVRVYDPSCPGCADCSTVWSKAADGAARWRASVGSGVGVSVGVVDDRWIWWFWFDGDDAGPTHAADCAAHPDHKGTICDCGYGVSLDGEEAAKAAAETWAQDYRSEVAETVSGVSWACVHAEEKRELEFQGMVGADVSVSLRIDYEIGVGWLPSFSVTWWWLRDVHHPAADPRVCDSIVTPDLENLFFTLWDAIEAHFPETKELREKIEIASIGFAVADE